MSGTWDLGARVNQPLVLLQRAKKDDSNDILFDIFGLYIYRGHMIIREQYGDLLCTGHMIQ